MPSPHPPPPNKSMFYVYRQSLGLSCDERVCSFSIIQKCTIYSSLQLQSFKNYLLKKNKNPLNLARNSCTNTEMNKQLDCNYRECIFESRCSFPLKHLSSLPVDFVVLGKQLSPTNIVLIANSKTSESPSLAQPKRLLLLHVEHRSRITIFLFRRLSTVKILPQAAVQVNKETFIYLCTPNAHPRKTYPCRTP